MDFSLALVLNHFGQGTRIDIVSQFISWTGTMMGIRIIVTIIAAVWKKQIWKKIVLSFVLAFGLAYFLSNVGFKTLLVHETGIRVRPFIAHTNQITPIGKQYLDSSFPSTHMMITLAMVTVLIMLFPTLRPYAVLYVLLMARSRMHNGMHYPSDVLAGSLLGFGCGWLAVLLNKKLIKPKN